MAQKSSGSNWLVWIIIAAIGFFAYKHFFNNQPITLSYAEEFKESLIKFEQESNETKKEVQKALEAYNEAKDVLFKYQDQRTQRFIKEWRRAEDKVKKLIKSYNELVEKANNFFKVLYDEAEKIHDPKLRSQVVALINERKKLFYEKAMRAKSGIEQLVVLMQKGDDLIKAIEIAGALKYSEIGKYDFEEFNYRLNQSFEELNSLIQEGKSILGSLSDNKIKMED
jgi:DNA repair ATPase RecN